MAATALVLAHKTCKKQADTLGKERRATLSDIGRASFSLI